MMKVVDIGTRIDLSIIDDLIGEDAVAKKEIIDLFVLHGQRTIDLLAKSVIMEDHQSVRDLAHKLKSSARSSGAILLGFTSEDL